jgi:hypothetical protein
MKTIFNSAISLLASSTLSATAKKACFGLAVALGTTFTAQAQQFEPVQVTQADAASLRIRINNPGQKAASLRVLHLENGEVLLDQLHRTPAYGTLLKFGGLPTGHYAVSMRVGPNRYRYVVQVSSKAPGSTAIAVQETTTHRVENGLASAAL